MSDSSTKALENLSKKYSGIIRDGDIIKGLLRKDGVAVYLPSEYREVYINGKLVFIHNSVTNNKLKKDMLKFQKSINPV